MRRLLLGNKLFKATHLARMCRMVSPCQVSNHGTVRFQTLNYRLAALDVSFHLFFDVLPAMSGFFWECVSQMPQCTE